ncbi:MAG TPA: type I restriction-modification system subunit M N-terminal domain-containing protein [Streptosporangiaceae bacterium]|jgi:type I restriction enzyme M protein
MALRHALFVWAFNPATCGSDSPPEIAAARVAGCTMLRSVITGELRSKIDRLWDAFWSGGISNPLEVIEQITYLMFIRRLDGIQTTKEHKTSRTGRPIESPIYIPDTNSLRWSTFSELQPERMYELVANGVFPWLRRLGGEDSTYSQHMKDARFTIPTPNLLVKAVDALASMFRDLDLSG